MSIFDWINSDDGPQFDDDDLTNDYIESCSGGKPTGVVRWNNGRRETGERDDLSKQKDKIEESLRRLREHDDIWDQLDRERKSQPKHGPRKAKQVYGKHTSTDTSADHGGFATSNTRADIYGTPTPGYVAPHERGKSGSGVIPLVVMMCLMLGLAQIFLG